MKKLKIILILAFVAVFGFSLKTGASSVLETFQGGTGTSTPSGLLYGDNGATTHLNTAKIGTGLSFTGGTLSSTGSASSTLLTDNNTFTGATTTFSNNVSFPYGIWNSSGKVGIGTITPGSNLEVGTIGSVTDLSVKDANGVLRLTTASGKNYIQSGTSYTSNTKADFRITSMLAGTTWFNIVGATGNVGIATTTNASKFGVQGNASIGADYAMAAPANGLIVEGNVGIGTTTPYATLSVNGNGVFNNNVLSSYFTATSTIASLFPYASTTALSATSLCIGADCRSAWPTVAVSATTTLLSDNNTFSGTNAFTTTINGSITGLAGTATKLATARAINGVNFDGSAPITINAASSTLLSDLNTFTATTTFSNLVTFGNQVGTRVTGSEKVMFEDADGLNSDWSFRVAGGGAGIGFGTINFAKSRGTLASPTDNNPTDYLGSLNFYGYHSGYKNIISLYGKDSGELNLYQGYLTVSTTTATSTFPRLSVSTGTYLSGLLNLWGTTATSWATFVANIYAQFVQYSTTFTATTAGSIGINTKNGTDQLQFFGTKQNVILADFSKAMTVGSTTLGWAKTNTYAMGSTTFQAWTPLMEAQTVNSVGCFTDNGTASMIAGNGIASTTMIFCTPGKLASTTASAMQIIPGVNFRYVVYSSSSIPDNVSLGANFSATSN